jgi:hypothetical protein
VWSNNHWAVGEAQQHHLLQVGYADHLLGRLIARLRVLGIWRQALVVVTADEGLSFIPGQQGRTVTPTDIGGVGSVPLFVKAPGQRRGRIDDGFVRTIDIVPTVAALLDTRIPFHVDGKPALRPARNGVVAVAEGSQGNVSVPFADFVHRRNAEVRRKLRMFGSAGWRSLYAFGPDPELIGRTAAPLVHGKASIGALSLSHDYGSVEPAAPLVPALVEGSLSGGLVPSQPLAVSVNGRIAATTMAYGLDGGVGLMAMVSPGAFRAGANRVEAFLIENQASGPRLLPIPTTGSGHD